MSSDNTIKGKRPTFFEHQGVDHLMHMVMVLVQEHSVMRDRLDTLERVIQEKNLLSQEDLEAYQPDQQVLEEREERRQALFTALFQLVAQETAEIESQDTKRRFEQVISDIASE